MTAQELIESSMRLLGVLEAGETPTTAELADGLESLNSLVAYWGTQSWGNYVLTQDTHTLVAGTATYTIGTGLTINTTTPNSIKSAWVRDDSNIDSSLEIISQAEYAAIIDKTVQSEPEKLLFTKSGTTGTITLWPVPSSADTLYILSHKPLTAYALSDNLGLPAEYERALRFNLASDYALEYQIEVSPTLAMKASESLDGLKALHTQPVPRMVTDMLNCNRPYNVYSDEV